MNKLYSLLALLVVATACRGTIDYSVAQLTLEGVTLTTFEDTPVSATVRVSGADGTLSPRVVTQGEHGTLVFTTGSSFTYTPDLDYAGADAVTVGVSDGSLEVTTTIAITITEVNDPPVLGAVPALTVDEDGVIALSLSNVPLIDVDSPDSDLHLMVLGGPNFLVNGNEVRPFADFADWLTVPIVIDDGYAYGFAQVDVSVTAINDPPDVTVPAPQQTNEDVAFTFGSSAHIGVADRDANTSPLAMELSADHGTVTLPSLIGLTFTTGDGTDDSFVSFSGTQAAINAALNGLVVTPNLGFSGLLTLTLTASDQGARGNGTTLTDTETFTLGVAANDLPPFNTIPDVVAAAEDQSFVFNGANSISLIDSDAPNGAVAEVTLSVSHGGLKLLATNGLTFLGGTADGEATLHFTGSLLAINNALDSLTYTPDGDFAGSDTLSFTTISNGLADSDPCAITVNAVNDAPVLNGPTVINGPSGAQVSFTGPRAVTVHDADAGSALVELTIVSSAGALSFAGTPAFTVDTPSVNTTVLTGTLNQFVADLSLMRWDPPTPVYTGTSTLAMSLSDLGNTGSPGALTDTLTITLNTVEPATANPETYKTPGNVQLTVAAPGVLANDSATNLLSVTSADATSMLGGTVAVRSDGGFTYTPPLGVGSRDLPGVLDSFSYVIANGGGTATVTIYLGRVIWFVDKDAGSLSGDGSSESPYDNIQAAAGAAADGPPGSTIWVAAAATPYVVDVEVPPATLLIGSRFAYESDATDDVPPLPALGTPVISNAGSNALHLTSNGRISGFSVIPGATHTGPAIVVDGANSGAIDNTTIDGFDTAITLHDTRDVVGVDSVLIKNAVTRAVRIDTSVQSTVFVANSTFTDVGNGIEAVSTAGLTNTGFLTLKVALVTGTGITNTGVALATAVASTTLDRLDVSSASFTGTATASRGVDIEVLSGKLEFQVMNVSISGFPGRGVALVMGSDPATTVNGHLDHVMLHDLGPVTFAHGIELKGGAGQLDLTVDDNCSVDNASGSGMRFDNSGGTMCLALSNAAVSGVTDDFTLVKSGGGSFAIDGYTGGDLATYLNGSPGPANIGTFTFTGAPFLPGTCLAPPVFP